RYTVSGLQTVFVTLCNRNIINMQMRRSFIKVKYRIENMAAGYIKNLKIDKDTGEINNIEGTLLLDIAKIE
ncbi:MAG: hypothetical protein LBI27_05305, partial [Clostridiales bacterium]|nr:hypothetical protein [Clostridiales bacterium]